MSDITWDHIKGLVNLIDGADGPLDTAKLSMLKGAVNAIQAEAAGSQTTVKASDIDQWRAALAQFVQPAPHVKPGVPADLQCKSAISEDQIKVLNDAVNMFNVLVKAAEAPPSFSYRDTEPLQATLLDQIYYWSRQSEFPEGDRGDVSGVNGLFRVNWFNGRFLTAEALRRQDTYRDIRNRLPAQIHPAGIAWGMGLRLERAPLPVLQMPMTVPVGTIKPIAEVKGIRSDQQTDTVTLEAGLAFDAAGRPIVVGKPFSFPFRSLLDNYRQRPQEVALQQRAFLPCVCIQKIDDIPPGDGPGITEGPYLIVIKPEEHPEGEAKVYGELCEDRGRVSCLADGWRGGFGLSLVKFPAPLGEDPPNDPWMLRGLLAAYYFDVFEHDLRRRWDPPFLQDDGFCRGLGPHDHRAFPVPLAMVYLKQDGSIFFFDPWIPRRATAATAAQTCHMQTFGAPKPAAAYARVHQFQCQLREHLTRFPLVGLSEKSEYVPVLVMQKEKERLRFRLADYPNPNLIEVGIQVEIYFRGEKTADAQVISITDGIAATDYFAETVNNEDYLVRITATGQELSFRNLYSRGFRHIPPVGFLPVEPRLQHGIGEIQELFQSKIPVDDLPPYIKARLFCFVKHQALSYFYGTNVYAYAVAALHDDDIFEDIQNAFYKDPITIEQGRSARRFDFCNLLFPGKGKAPPIQSLLEGIFRQFASYKSLAVVATQPTIVLAWVLAAATRQLNLDLFINRRIELVKVIIPLQGVHRRHPLSENSELNDQLVKEWLQGIDDAVLRQKLLDLLRDPGSGLGSMPRHFAVYVKQRVVLLDALYLLIELLLSLPQQDPAVGSMIGGNYKAYKYQSVNSISEVFSAQGEEKRAVVQALMADESGQDLIAESIISASAELRILDRWEDFWKLVETTETKLEETIVDSNERRLESMKSAVEDFSVEHEEYSLLKPIVAMAPGSLAAESILRRATRKASLNPALDNRGRVRAEGIGKALIHPEGLRRLDTESRFLWSIARAAMVKRKLSDIVETEDKTPLDSLLRLSEEEASQRIGKKNYAIMKRYMPALTQKLLSNIRYFSANPPDEQMVNHYHQLLEIAENDEGTALAKLQEKLSGNEAAKAYLDRFNDIKQLVGEEGKATLARAVFRRGRVRE
ncbi:hypothetical protein D3OALGB2SA_5503 [Olavius algarvensis associated proteobacterium Delta 3]|nr:hypothetical protein D3OALGB2SA_5503 [Olavius algarvensis associated proteobacterium Delta 3]